jgi:adenine phosphoribosyltransferase
MTEALRSRLREAFAWVDGHADVWRFFTDAELFRELAEALAEPFRDARVTKVTGIEARGFIIGAAVALELRAGFVAIRKRGGLFPGEKVERDAVRDYRGKTNSLQLQRSSLLASDRVVLVDDWFETGSQALAAKELIQACGASFVGATVIVDQLPDDVRARLGSFHALLRARELGAEET